LTALVLKNKIFIKGKEVYHMIPSIVNPKVIHRAMSATADPYESALDSGMDFVEPVTPGPRYFGNNKGCFEEPSVRKMDGLARTEKKFGVQVIGVLDKRRVNGYYRARLLCLDGTELYDDVSLEEIKFLPEIRKTSAIAEWEAGGYPVDPIINLAFHKEENTDKLASCFLCGSILLHSKDGKRHICPECFPNISLYGNTFLEGETIGQGLIRASARYANECFQKWIIKAVLLLDAPVPEVILKWKGEEYFGYGYKPALYYRDGSGCLNCVEVQERKLTYRKITGDTCDNDLDRQAWKMAQTEELPLEIEEIICHSPYLKGQWLVKEGNRRIGVYREINGFLWCNCAAGVAVSNSPREADCRHIQAVKEEFGISTENNNDDGDNTPSLNDEIHCAICSRTLTAPESVFLQIGPECRKRIGLNGVAYLQDDNVVSGE